MYANDAYQNTLRSHEHPNAQQTLAFGVAFNRQHVRGILLMDARIIIHTNTYTALYIYIFFTVYLLRCCATICLFVCLFVLSQAASAFLPQPCYQFFSALRLFSPPLLFDCLLARLLTFLCENYSYQ